MFFLFWVYFGLSRLNFPYFVYTSLYFLSLALVWIFCAFSLIYFALLSFTMLYFSLISFPFLYLPSFFSLLLPFSFLRFALVCFGPFHFALNYFSFLALLRLAYRSPFRPAGWDRLDSPRISFLWPD